MTSVYRVLGDLVYIPVYRYTSQILFSPAPEKKDDVVARLATAIHYRTRELIMPCDTVCD